MVIMSHCAVGSCINGLHKEVFEKAFSDWGKKKKHLQKCMRLHREYLKVSMVDIFDQVRLMVISHHCCHYFSNALIDWLEMNVKLCNYDYTQFV